MTARKNTHKQFQIARDASGLLVNLGIQVEANGTPHVLESIAPKQRRVSSGAVVPVWQTDNTLLEHGIAPRAEENHTATFWLPLGHQPTFLAMLIICQVLEAMKLHLHQCGNLKAQLHTRKANVGRITLNRQSARIQPIQKSYGSVERRSNGEEYEA